MFINRFFFNYKKTGWKKSLACIAQLIHYSYDYQEKTFTNSASLIYVRRDLSYTLTHIRCFMSLCLLFIVHYPFVNKSLLRMFYLEEVFILSEPE